MGPRLREDPGRDFPDDFYEETESELASSTDSSSDLDDEQTDHNMSDASEEESNESTYSYGDGDEYIEQVIPSNLVDKESAEEGPFASEFWRQLFPYR